MISAMSATPFTGFDRRFFAFLKALKAHNTREWFTAHKAQYQADVEAPALAFVAAFAPKLKTSAPDKARIVDDELGKLKQAYPGPTPGLVPASGAANQTIDNITAADMRKPGSGRTRNICSRVRCRFKS